LLKLFDGVGEIKLKREHSSDITTRVIKVLHKQFESKKGAKKILNSERVNKMKILSSVAPNLQHLLYPLFNEN